MISWEDYHEKLETLEQQLQSAEGSVFLGDVEKASTADLKLLLSSSDVRYNNIDITLKAVHLIHDFL